MSSRVPSTFADTVRVNITLLARLVGILVCHHAGSRYVFGSTRLAVFVKCCVTRVRAGLCIRLRRGAAPQLDLAATATALEMMLLTAAAAPAPS